MIQSWHRSEKPSSRTDRASFVSSPIVARLVALGSTEPERIGFEFLDHGEGGQEDFGEMVPR